MLTFVVESTFSCLGFQCRNKRLRRLCVVLGQFVELVLKNCFVVFCTAISLRVENRRASEESFAVGSTLINEEKVSDSRQ